MSKPRLQAVPNHNPSEHPSFVKNSATPRPNGSRRSFWAVKPTGHFQTDFLIGRGLAIDYMEWEGGRRPRDAHPILHWVVESMIRSRDRTESFRAS
jgi:hypothetical protein